MDKFVLFKRPAGFRAGLLFALILILLSHNLLPAWLPPLAIVLLVLFFIARAIKQRSFTGYTPADWPLFLLLLLLPIGLLVSPQRALTLDRSYALIASAILFWLLAAQRNAPWLRHSSWLLLLIGAGLALTIFAFTTFPARLPLLNLDVTALQARSTALFLSPGRFNPNLSGSLAALFLVPALACTVYSVNRIQRLLALLLGLLLTLLLYLSQSRGAQLGVLLSIPFFTLLANRRWLWLWIPLGVLALAAVLIFPDSLTALLFAGSSNAVSTLQGRQELWSRALYLIQDFPFTGVGMGAPETVINTLYPMLTINRDLSWLHVHNTYLQMAAEMGVVGLIAWLAWLFSVGVVGIKQAATPHAATVHRSLALGLTGSWLVFLVHGLVDVPLASPKLMLLFFGLMGLLVAAATSDPVSRTA